MGRANSFTRRPAALRGVQLKHIAHVHEADDVVDGLLVDGDAGILLVNHQLAQILERAVSFDGHDLGPGSHHLANRFVAERHHARDKPAVLLFDDSFFLAGRDERFNIVGWARGLYLRLFWLRQFHQGLEESEDGRQRTHQNRAHAEHGGQREQPVAAGFPIQQGR